MVLLWSINFVVAKVVLREFPPLLAGALRFTIAGALIWPVFLWRRGWTMAQSWNFRDVGSLLALGLLGVGMNQIFFLLGLMRTSVAHASILMVTIPVIVLLLAAAMRQEQLSARKVLGLIIAISGVVLLNAAPSRSGASSGLGDLFIFLAALVFALFTVFGKSVRHRFDGLTVNTFAYTGSSLVMLPLTLWLARDFPFGSVSVWGWVALLFMALFPSLLCYSIYYHALHYIAPSRITSLAYLQPLLATFFAVALLGESVSGGVVSGGLLVLIGVFLTQRP
jgi:drug/metabolite transporter (DMT)-like permease